MRSEEPEPAKRSRTVSLLAAYFALLLPVACTADSSTGQLLNREVDHLDRRPMIFDTLKGDGARASRLVEDFRLLGLREVERGRSIFGRR